MHYMPCSNMPCMPCSKYNELRLKPVKNIPVNDFKIQS